jgi:hypothetical protein
MSERLSEEIRVQLRRLGLESTAGEATDAWARAVGAEIASNAWPARTLADGTLVVHVRDAIWGFELTQRATEISARLPGRPRLRFVPGPVPEPPVRRPGGACPAPTPEQVREAGEIAAAIGDPALREVVVRAIQASLARRRHDRPV